MCNVECIHTRVPLPVGLCELAEIPMDVFATRSLMCAALVLNMPGEV